MGEHRVVNTHTGKSEKEMRKEANQQKTKAFGPMEDTKAIKFADEMPSTKKSKDSKK